ncbi:STAS-like domain-containing protein [Enterovirga sp.]|uniref:STAS-like domain-containing protein n=1 Tax=Enterovirga sp. TaxID=2026350 RepID=UPI002CFCC000|nr:STAS-like domain-containing protein [Enterovirga sp.]HMO30409.1 STAS-like domain-containing protein [Enterovirga sp.]
MVIRIADLVGAADTGDQGAIVYRRISMGLRRGGPIVISFSGITTATSSFVNAGFVELLRDHPFSEIKDRLRVIDSTHQINDMIRTRLNGEASKAAA